MKKYKNLALWKKILIGAAVGLILGFISPAAATKISFIGTIFINLLQIMLVPLVFFTLVSGFCKSDNISQVKKVGGRIVVYYLATTVIAASVGLTMALILQPGRGVTDLVDASAKIEPQAYSFIDTLVSWFPNNIISSMANGEMIPVIFFSIFLGVVLLTMRDKVPTLIQFFEEGSRAYLKSLV